MSPRSCLFVPSVLVALGSALYACPRPPHPGEHAEDGILRDSASAAEAGDASEPELAEDEVIDGGELPFTVDDSPLHKETTEELLTLFGYPSAGAFLRWTFGPAPGKFNQGNPALARHDVARAACLEGLQGTTLQTDEQRARCHGLENMVPIYKKGDPSKAKVCIDVFEFPNKACELPMVWGTPAQAARICALQGKRLCDQSEWNLACAGDPQGKPDSLYAYGNDLDMTICNTNRPHHYGPDGQWICSVRTAQNAWETCATETEPSGAFPKCRSRFGVYDQHGNVAEMMTRPGADGVTLTQLKGSAFFYVDVSRKPNEAQKPGSRETYPDHCNFDPRWHVEVLEKSLHSNYHLGFRCCLSI